MALADIVIRSFNALLWLLVINLAITIFLLAFQICFHSVLFFLFNKSRNYSFRKYRPDT